MTDPHDEQVKHLYDYNHKSVEEQANQEAEQFFKEFQKRKKQIEIIQNSEEKRRATEDLKIWYHTETSKSALKYAIEDKGLDLKDGFIYLIGLISPLSSPRSPNPQSNTTSNKKETVQVHKPIHVKKKDKEENVQIELDSE
eukprot:gene7794-12268_t